MKLSTVVEILELNVTTVAKRMPPDTLLALRIAIEAVKARAERQAKLSPQLRQLLPGETKD